MSGSVLPKVSATAALIPLATQDNCRDNAGHPTNHCQDRDNNNGPASFIKDGQGWENNTQQNAKATHSIVSFSQRSVSIHNLCPSLVMDTVPFWSVR
jgi:hypothetical protein